MVVEAKPKDQKLPTDAYYSVEEVHDVSLPLSVTSVWTCVCMLFVYQFVTRFCTISQDGTPTTKTFEHVGSEIGAEEAEEVGVEHLLRYLISLFSMVTNYLFCFSETYKTRQ